MKWLFLSPPRNLQKTICYFVNLKKFVIGWEHIQHIMIYTLQQKMCKKIRLRLKTIKKERDTHVCLIGGIANLLNPVQNGKMEDEF